MNAKYMTRKKERMDSVMAARVKFHYDLTLV
ncbi:protein of unknown function [Mesotoga infera]|uniref:Uncharacterized protein n=1 Tax=Mesotoga infera TaxID=1236046 RepID=A0A7Z7LF24_9BACT|nr:protein of unknown function [Mesotoga infera]